MSWNFVWNIVNHDDTLDLLPDDCVGIFLTVINLQLTLTIIFILDNHSLVEKVHKYTTGCSAKILVHGFASTKTTVIITKHEKGNWIFPEEKNSKKRKIYQPKLLEFFLVTLSFFDWTVLKSDSELTAAAPCFFYRQIDWTVIVCAIAIIFSSILFLIWILIWNFGVKKSKIWFYFLCFFLNFIRTNAINFNVEKFKHFK